MQRYDTQHTDIQHNNTQHDDIQHKDIQHKDIQHNDTQRQRLVNDTEKKWLREQVKLSITILCLILMLFCWMSHAIYYNAECHYAECRNVDCRGAF